MTQRNVFVSFVPRKASVISPKSALASRARGDGQYWTMGHHVPCNVSAEGRMASVIQQLPMAMIPSPPVPYLHRQGIDRGGLF